MKNYRLVWFLLIVGLVTGMAVIATQTTSAQSDYARITTIDGVDAYWRTVKPQYGDNYVVLYKFVNRNSYRAQVNYEATFRCGIEQGKEDYGTFVLSAGGSKQGEGDGLYTYPCGTSRPASINLKMSVERDN